MLIEKDKDPRVPAWQGIVKGAKVTIYDMQAYEESKHLYPDSDDTPCTSNKIKDTPRYTKQKPAARYNWTQKLPVPLRGKL